MWGVLPGRVLPRRVLPRRTLTFWRWGVPPRRVLPGRARVQKLRARLERNITRGGQGSTLRGQGVLEAL